MGKFKEEGNKLVTNQSDNVLVNYNFMLRVEGIYDLPCKSVHSFTKENEFEYVQEGGLNDYVHMLRKPVSKPFSFTVERYVGMDIIPPLPLGAELVLPVILMVSPNANQFDNAKRTFVFTGCTVMSKTYGELNAEKSDLLTETIVIGYREMTEITIPVHLGSEGKRWDFDGKNVNGNGKRSARTLDKKENKAEARQWPTVDSRKTLPKGTTTDDNKDNKNEARQWPKVSSAKVGVDTGEAEVRQWKPEKESDAKPVNSAKPGVDTGEAKVRKWKEVNSRKTLPETTATDNTEDDTGNANGPRKWKTVSSAKVGVDTGEAEVRQWKPEKESDAKPVNSAKVGVDTGEAKVRQWPEESSAKVGVDTGEAEVRKWKEESSAKVGADTGEAEVRQWPEVSSAKVGNDTGEATKRRWEPVKSAREELNTGNAQNRKWPPTESAKKI